MLETIDTDPLVADSAALTMFNVAGLFLVSLDMVDSAIEVGEGAAVSRVVVITDVVSGVESSPDQTSGPTVEPDATDSDTVVLLAAPWCPL